MSYEDAGVLCHCVQWSLEVCPWLVARGTSSSTSHARGCCLGCWCVAGPWREHTPPGHPASLPGLWWGRALAVRNVSNVGLTCCRWDGSRAGVVSSMNGLSCGQGRGKDCCTWKLSTKAIKIWGGGGLVMCVLHVIQSPVRESPCKIWYSKSALLCPCFGRRPWMSEGGIFSRSESSSLSESVWAHGAEAVCRSWCCTCSSVRCPVMKKFSFQHCQVSTSPTSDTIAGVVLSQWQSSHHRNCTYNLTSFRVYQELRIFGMFNGILICKVRSLQ